MRILHRDFRYTYYLSNGEEQVISDTWQPILPSHNILTEEQIEKFMLARYLPFLDPTVPRKYRLPLVEKDRDTFIIFPENSESFSTYEEGIVWATLQSLRT